jgi:hypothetical protein
MHACMELDLPVLEMADKCTGGRNIAETLYYIHTVCVIVCISTSKNLQ